MGKSGLSFLDFTVPALAIIQTRLWLPEEMFLTTLAIMFGVTLAVVFVATAVMESPQGKPED